MMVYVMVSNVVPSVMLQSGYGMIFNVVGKQETQFCQLDQIASNLSHGQNMIQPNFSQR